MAIDLGKWLWIAGIVVDFGVNRLARPAGALSSLENGSRLAYQAYLSEIA